MACLDTRCGGSGSLEAPAPPHSLRLLHDAFMWSRFAVNREGCPNTSANSKCQDVYVRSQLPATSRRLCSGRRRTKAVELLRIAGSTPHRESRRVCPAQRPRPTEINAKQWQNASFVISKPRGFVLRGIDRFPSSHGTPSRQTPAPEWGGSDGLSSVRFEPYSRSECVVRTGPCLRKFRRIATCLVAFRLSTCYAWG